ncbi:MAG: hypothetical protein QM538_04300 [Methylacidiphilales bacterium]|nr:hypothetical protein [Candidatus Methylacidiphilales bacterium]
MDIYLVGGAIRDSLLNLPVLEKDWVVVGSTPREMESLKYRQVGKQFPVFLHPITNEEYALARTEVKKSIGYTGFICDFSPKVTLEEDLWRRDFTINSIAFDEKSGTYIDPCEGMKDIKNKIIRHTSIAFSEDPLRLIRLARFYAKLKPLGFTIAPETLELVIQIVNNGELPSLSVERLWTEFEKAFTYQDPDAFIEVLISSTYASTTGLKSLFEQPCREALRYISAHNSSPLIRFAGFCARASDSDIINFTNWLPVPNRYTELVTKVRKNFNSYYHSPTLTISNILSLLYDCNGFKQGEVYENFLTCCELVSKSRAEYQNIPHPQTKFLQTMLHVAKTVTGKSLMRLRLEGEEITKEIDKQRCAAMCKIRRPYRWAEIK